VNAGNTFILSKDQAAIDDHLWIIVSDTNKFANQVVIVSVTTYAPEKDQACILERGDHPRITHRSCISYFHAKVVTLAQLWQLKDSGSILMQDDVSAEFLEKIRRCSGDSLDLPEGIAEILVGQGFIRLDE